MIERTNRSAIFITCCVINLEVIRSVEIYIYILNKFWETLTPVHHDSSVRRLALTVLVQVSVSKSASISRALGNPVSDVLVNMITLQVYCGWGEREKRER